jgi:hypothetical protein
MKYAPRRDIPDFARELRSVSPSKIAHLILTRRNVERTPESVTMWFGDHHELFDELEKEIIAGQPTVEQSVDCSLFENHSFQEIESIRNWVLEMNARELDQNTIRDGVGTIRLVCQGRFPKKGLDFVASGKWCFKHPDRLHLQDALEIIKLLREANVDTYQHKKFLKDFLISKGEVVGKKFTVGRPKSFGKYAKMKASETQLQNIIGEVEAKNKKAGVADEFMLKTATRVNATLKVRIDDMVEVGDHALVTVFDKGRRSKYAEGKPWDKKLDTQLYQHILGIIGDRESGAIFEGLNEVDLGKLNHDAICHWCPEVVERYPDFLPNHFFRHCFAQIMLVRTNWNYAVVAALGGWTVKALEESYGQPPDEIVNEWATKYSLEINL